MATIMGRLIPGEGAMKYALIASLLLAGTSAAWATIPVPGPVAGAGLAPLAMLAGVAIVARLRRRR